MLCPCEKNNTRYCICALLPAGFARKEILIVFGIHGMLQFFGEKEEDKKEVSENDSRFPKIGVTSFRKRTDVVLI